MNYALSISRHSPLRNALRFPPVVKPLAAFFRDRSESGGNVEAYLVGGVLRDALMGRSADDLDISVSEDAGIVGGELAAALGGRCSRLHTDWQVARVYLPEGLGASHIDISTIQGNIGQDLHRRDFTINAMALPMDAAAIASDVRMRLLDPCDGLRDLRDGVVRMTSSAALDEDCARLMRGARLAAQFGFSLDSETTSAIRARAHRVAGAAQERMRDELMRLLRTPNARDGVRLLDDLGLLCSIMPELAQSKGVTQPKEHYWDVFNHLVEAVGWVDAMFDCRAAAYPINLIPRFSGIDEYFSESASDGFDRLTFLKLTALLHDIAKPATKTVEDSGRIRFFGHHAEGADIARDVLARLRFSNKGVEHVAGMVRHHLRPRLMAQDGELPTRRALYRYYRDVGDVALDTLYLNTADYLAARGPMLEREEWASHCNLIQRILLEEGRSQEGKRRENSLLSLPRLVSGHEIIDKFALAEGPAIGRLLELVREAQASEEITTKEQALELVGANLERGGDGA